MKTIAAECGETKFENIENSINNDENKQSALQNIGISLHILKSLSHLKLTPEVSSLSPSQIYNVKKL